MQCLYVELDFLTRLVTAGVLDHPNKEDIEANPTSMARVYELMDHIRRDPQTRFQPFIEVLRERKEYDALRLLTLPEEQAQSGGPFSQPRTETASQSNAKKKEELVLAKLENVEPVMYGKLRCDVELLGYLVQEGALHNLDRTKLTEMRESMDRIQALFGHIRRDPIPRYEGFLHALVKSGQEHIVTDILQEPLPGDEDVGMFQHQKGMRQQQVDEEYNKAVKEGKAETCRGRLVVLGRAGAGKTSVVNAILGKEFSTEHILTDLLDIHYATIDEEGMWEHQEASDMRKYEEENLVAQAMKQSQRGANKEGPKHEVSTDVQVVREQAKAEPSQQKRKQEKIPAAVQGLLEEEKLDKKDGMHIWDFAGQLLYYIVHQLFITATTIFLLVVDGSNDLDAPIPPEYAQSLELNLKTERDYVEYFLKTGSIWGKPEGAQNDWGPPHAFLLLNKADLVSQEELDKRLEEVKKLVEETPAFEDLVREVLPFTSNPTPDDKGRPQVTSYEESCSELKGYLQDVKEHFVDEVPIKWLKLKNKLQEKSYTSYKDAVEIAESLNIDQNTVKSVLYYFHQHRELVYWDTEGLRDMVICQPNWLINEMRKIITVKEEQKHEYNSLKLRRHIKSLKKEKILHEELAKELWKERYKVMVEIMQKYLLLLPWTENKPGEHRYLVPCLLDTMKDTDHIQETKDIPPIYFYLQDGVIPIGLTTRLVTLLATTKGWRDGKDLPNIYFNGAKFTLNEKGTIVIISLEEILWKPCVGKEYEAKRENMKEQTVIQVKAGLTSEINGAVRRDAPQCLNRARKTIEDGISYILSMINVSQSVVTAEESHCKHQLLPRTSQERVVCNICYRTDGHDDLACWFGQKLCIRKPEKTGERETTEDYSMMPYGVLQGSKMDEKTLKNHLEKREADILRYIQVNGELLANLLKFGAIDGASRQKIQEEIHNSSRIHVLFEYVGLDILKRLNPLLHALRETNQTNAADKITDGLNLNQQGDVVIETASKHTASCSSASSMNSP